MGFSIIFLSAMTISSKSTCRRLGDDYELMDRFMYWAAALIGQLRSQKDTKQDKFFLLHSVFLGLLVVANVGSARRKSYAQFLEQRKAQGGHDYFLKEILPFIRAEKSWQKRLFREQPEKATMLRNVGGMGDWSLLHLSHTQGTLDGRASGISFDLVPGHM